MKKSGVLLFSLHNRQLVFDRACIAKTHIGFHQRPSAYKADKLPSAPLRNMKYTCITIGANALPYWAYPLTTHRSRSAISGRGMMLPGPQHDSCAILQLRPSNPNRCCFVAFWFPNNVFNVQRHDNGGGYFYPGTANRPDWRQFRHHNCVCIWASRSQWSEMRDSNPRHPAPKAGALPTALIPGLIFGNFIGVLIQESH